MKKFIIIAVLTVIPTTGFTGPDDDSLATRETSLAELAGNFTDMLSLIAARKRKLAEYEQKLNRKYGIVESCDIEQQELELADKERIVTPAW